jgi:hypothetical protein
MGWTELKRQVGTITGQTYRVIRIDREEPGFEAGEYIVQVYSGHGYGWQDIAQDDDVRLSQEISRRETLIELGGPSAVLI